MGASKIIVVFTLLISFGCSRTNTEEKMLDCITEKKPGFIGDFLILEKELLERNLLINNSKQGYLQLLESPNSINWSTLNFDPDKLINPGIIAKIIDCQNQCNCENQEYYELIKELIGMAIKSQNPIIEMRLSNLTSKISGIDEKYFDSELFRLLVFFNIYAN